MKDVNTYLGKTTPTTSINPVVVLKLSDNPPATLPPPPTHKKVDFSITKEHQYFRL